MLNQLQSQKVIEVIDVSSGEIFEVSNAISARKIILQAFEQEHELYISRKEREE